MQGFTFIVLFAIFGLFTAIWANEVQVDPTIIHRVKRSPTNANLTKASGNGNENGNVTIVIVVDGKTIKTEPTGIPSSVANETKKVNEDDASKKRETLHPLKTPRTHLLRQVRHSEQKQNASAPSVANVTLSFLKDLGKLHGEYITARALRRHSKRNAAAANKEHELEHGIGEQRSHHDITTLHLGKSFITKDMDSNPRQKFKRSHVSTMSLDGENLFRLGRAHENEHDVYRYNVDNSPIHAFEQLADLMMNLNEDEKQSRVKFDEEVPYVKEIIFNPMELAIAAATVTNDVSPNGMNDYVANKFGSSMPKGSRSNAGAPMAYESPVTIVSDAFPFNLLALREEASLMSRKDNPNEEYEMTCPVHFKRSINGNTQDGVIETCSCHLFKKNKLV